MGDQAQDCVTNIAFPTFKTHTVAASLRDTVMDALMDADGTLRFRFGGVVRLIGDVDGEFRGDVPVDVEYF